MFPVAPATAIRMMISPRSHVLPTLPPSAPARTVRNPAMLRLASMKANGAEY